MKKILDDIVGEVKKGNKDYLRSCQVLNTLPIDVAELDVKQMYNEVL